MKKRGFTLLELLVVIAIIGLLATVVIASLGPARAKGRDATRIKSIQEVAKALELYYNDNGRYPIPASVGAGALSGTECDSSRGGVDCTENSPTGDTWRNTGGGLYEIVDAGYISKLPEDPTNTEYFFYAYSSCRKGTNAGQTYRLRTHLEYEDKYFIISNGKNKDEFIFDLDFDGIISKAQDGSVMSSCVSTPFGACMIADIASRDTSSALQPIPDGKVDDEADREYFFETGIIDSINLLCS